MKVSAGTHPCRVADLRAIQAADQAHPGPRRFPSRPSSTSLPLRVDTYGSTSATGLGQGALRQRAAAALARNVVWRGLVGGGSPWVVALGALAYTRYRRPLAPTSDGVRPGRPTHQMRELCTPGRPPLYLGKGRGQGAGKAYPVVAACTSVLCVCACVSVCLCVCMYV